ncbi:hypothetical protein [Nostoc sp.]
MSTLPFILNMIGSWIHGEQAPKNPWRAIGLEWLVASPPPVENFVGILVVVGEPDQGPSSEPLVCQALKSSRNG